MARGQWTPVSRLMRCCIFSPSVRCNIRSACALRGKSAVGRGGNIQSIIFSRPMLQMLQAFQRAREARHHRRRAAGATPSAVCISWGAVVTLPQRSKNVAIDQVSAVITPFCIAGRPRCHARTGWAQRAERAPANTKWSGPPHGPAPWLDPERAVARATAPAAHET